MSTFLGFLGQSDAPATDDSGLIVGGGAGASGQDSVAPSSWYSPLAQVVSATSAVVQPQNVADVNSYIQAFVLPPGQRTTISPAQAHAAAAAHAASQPMSMTTWLMIGAGLLVLGKVAKLY